MTVLILHGIEGHAGIHWQQWLHDQLIKRGYKVIMPNLANPAHPDRKTWLAEISKITEDTDPAELIIVAHSLGVTSALDYLEAGKAKVFIAVSGFAEDYGSELNSYFMKEKLIDFEKVNKNIQQAFVIYGDDDPYVSQEALEGVAGGLEVAKPVVIPGGGHLNSEAGFNQFPQLLKMVLAIR